MKPKTKAEQLAMEELEWVGINWIQVTKQQRPTYFQELVNQDQLYQKALEKQIQYNQSLEQYKQMEGIPPGGAEELAMEELYG